MPGGLVCSLLPVVDAAVATDAAVAAAGVRRVDVGMAVEGVEAAAAGAVVAVAVAVFGLDLSKSVNRRPNDRLHTEEPCCLPTARGSRTTGRTGLGDSIAQPATVEAPLRVCVRADMSPLRSCALRQGGKPDGAPSHRAGR